METLEEKPKPYYYVVEFCVNNDPETSKDVPNDNRHLNKKNEFEKVTKPDQIKRFGNKETALKMAQVATNIREGAVLKVFCNLYDSELEKLKEE